MRDPQLFREISADLAREAAVEGDPVGWRLRNHFGLGRDLVGKVREEFCRFAYLTRIAEAPLAAPPVLAELWHGKAREIAGGGSGGAESKPHGLWNLARSAAYGRTLDLYRAEFGTLPPRRIWPLQEDLIRAIRVFWVMLGGCGLGCLGAWFVLGWVAGAGVGIFGLCVSWLTFWAPLAVTRPGD